MDEFAKRLGENLSEIYKNVTKLEENTLKQGNINLTIAEVHIVSLLSKNEIGLTVSDIAKYMDVSKPTITATVNRIVKKGFACKQSDLNDARLTYVKLTQEGQRVAILHKKCQRDTIKNLGDEFSQEQREILLKAIEKLNLYFKNK